MFYNLATTKRQQKNLEETLTSIGTQFRNVTYTYDSRGFTGHEHYDFLHVINV